MSDGFSVSSFFVVILKFYCSPEIVSCFFFLAKDKHEMALFVWCHFKDNNNNHFTMKTPLIKSLKENHHHFIDSHESKWIFDDYFFVFFNTKARTYWTAICVLWSFYELPLKTAEISSQMSRDLLRHSRDPMKFLIRKMIQSLIQLYWSLRKNWESFFSPSNLPYHFHTVASPLISNQRFDIDTFYRFDLFFSFKLAWSYIDENSFNTHSVCCLLRIYWDFFLMSNQRPTD